MRLRRRSEAEETPAPAVPEATPSRAPVTEAALAFREMVETIPVGDREQVWSRVVARVEAELERRASAGSAPDAPAPGSAAPAADSADSTLSALSASVPDRADQGSPKGPPDAEVA